MSFGAQKKDLSTASQRLLTRIRLRLQCRLLNESLPCPQIKPICRMSKYQLNKQAIQNKLHTCSGGSRSSDGGGGGGGLKMSFFCPLGVANGTSSKTWVSENFGRISKSRKCLLFLSLETFYQRVSGSDFELGSQRLGKSRILPFATPPFGLSGPKVGEWRGWICP